MQEPLNIEEIVRRTGLEESLLRFYESEYPDEFPKKILRGGTLFFDPASILIFRDIHERHQSGEKKKPGQTERYARVIAVTSGKGGVGKTNIALNLAIELQHQGKMSVVLDADLGLANVHLLSGITPRHSLMDLIQNKTDIADLIEAGPEGIGVVAGGNGILAMADSHRHDRYRIIESLVELEKAADIILVDTGAGMGQGVRDFLIAADEIIFVITPDITSLADAYGLLKALHKERMEARPIHLVVNMVQTLKQAANVSVRFTSCAREFLGREINNAGYILRDNTVSLATARQTPYTVYRPMSRVSKNTRSVAQHLLKEEIPSKPGNSAFSRYMNLIRGHNQMNPPKRKSA